LTHPRSLIPREPAALAHTLRTVGLALAACEKSVQIVYERGLRPAEKQHQPWVVRVTGQLLAACDGLEAQLASHPLVLTRTALDQAGVSTAVAWAFIQNMLPEVVPASRYPKLVAFSQAAEALPEFRAAPHGDSTYRPA
ncbi:MAG: glutathione S-transferase, partial [Rhodoferax sp.]|nr:glutathione S-transferase [Rhodoferax sp.]